MTPAGKQAERALRAFAGGFRSGRYAMGRMVLLSVLVGIMAGIGASAFYCLLDIGKFLFLDAIAGYRPSGPLGEIPMMPETARPFSRWWLLIIPALGGVLSGWLVARFAPEAEGHGTDAAIDAYHHKAGSVRARVPLVKAIASAITIGSGGSGGREGPIAQIGSGLGALMARYLKLEPRERRILMASGMAAGIGAIFHAPMAGALFAAEVMYRELDLEYEVVIPAIISSVIAYAVFAVQFGWSPLFVTPAFVFESPAQLIPYLGLAVATAGGAILYIKAFYGVRTFFHKSKIPLWLRPAVGGLLTGVIGFFLPQALGTGYGIIQELLLHGASAAETLTRLGIPILLAVFFAKIVTTSFSIGSGGSGGVFGPAVVIGGCLGGAVGLLMDWIFPGMNIEPGAFVIVGMAAFFGAAANTPISTIIMVSEMTGNYHLLVPSMWVCIIAYLMKRRFSLYENQLPSRFDAPVHRGNMVEGILKHATVGHALAREAAGVCITVRETASLRELLGIFSRYGQSSFPVVDGEGRLSGIVTGRELRSVFQTRGELDHLLITSDLVRPAVTVTMGDSLLVAVRRMAAATTEEVVVVDGSDATRPVGILSHRAIMAAYHAELAHIEDETPAEPAKR